MRYILYMTLMCLLCAACGPKNVGEDESAPAPDNHQNMSADSELRFPMSGSRVHQRLYYMNQPDVMIRIQEERRDYMQRRTGLTPGPNDYRNLQPRQASPFRQ